MKSFKESFETLEKSEVFRKWRKQNQKSYLSYGFVMLPEDGIWRIGYYHPDNNEVTSFVVSDEIAEEPNDEAFNKPDSTVRELKLENIKIPIETALNTAENLRKEKYKKEVPLKSVVIIQNHEELGNIWNITYISQSFKALNIKVDANAGNVLFDELIELFEWQKK